MKRARRKWTTDEDNTLIAMRGEGKTYKQVARKLKRSRPSVATRVTSLREMHGDTIIHRGGVTQARRKMKEAKKANAKTLSKHMPLPTDRSGRGQTLNAVHSELKDVRNLFRIASAENDKLKKRRDELLAELTEVGRQLANTRLEVEDKSKQLKSQARHILELASEQAKLRNIIIEMVAERFSGE